MYRLHGDGGGYRERLCAACAALWALACLVAIHWMGLLGNWWR